MGCSHWASDYFHWTPTLSFPLLNYSGSKTLWASVLFLYSVPVKELLDGFALMDLCE